MQYVWLALQGQVKARMADDDEAPVQSIMDGNEQEIFAEDVDALHVTRQTHEQDGGSVQPCLELLTLCCTDSRGVPLSMTSHGGGFSLLESEAWPSLPQACLLCPLQAPV